MTDREIRLAVARGQGRAIIFLRDHPERARFELLFDLCSRNQTFDRQTEDRGDYMERLADTGPDKDSLVEALGRRLFSSRDRRSRSQMRAVLSHFASRRHPVATDCLVKDFHRFRLAERPFVHAVEYLGRAGLDLLLGEVHRLEEWEIRRVGEDSVKALGEEVTKAAFDRAGVPLPMLEVNRTKQERQLLLPSAVLTKIEAGEIASVYDFVMLATKEDWGRAAEMALNSNNARVVLLVSRLFRRRSFPIPAGQVIARAERDADLGLKRARLLLLSATRSPVIRSWAVERLKSKKVDQEIAAAFDLMRLNATDSDEPIFFTALARLRARPEAFHRGELAALDLRIEASTRLLNLLYEYGPCSLCREGVVKRLLARNVLTKAQRAECLEDASDYTREMAGGNRRPG